MLQRAGSWLIVILLLQSGIAAAQYVSLTVDNDFFARADRHYTGGLQLGVLLDAPSIPPPVRALPPVSWTEDPQLILAFGQRIYAPYDLHRVPADPEDRPYAGWTYLLADVRTKRGEVVDHVTAAIGIVGPGSGAQQVQRLTHQLFGSRHAESWGSQLHNEIGGLVGFERAWMGLLHSDSGARQVDFSARAGGAVATIMRPSASSARHLIRRNVSTPRSTNFRGRRSAPRCRDK